MAAQAADRLERPDTGRHIRRSERPPEVRTEGEDEVHAAGGYARPPESAKDRCRLAQVDAWPQIPLHEGMRVRALSEDAELGHGHRAPDTVDQRPRDLAPKAREVVDERVESTAIENEEQGVSIGDRGRSPGPTVDQGDLAEEVAWPEPRESLSLAFDDDVARRDDEELIPALALPHEDVAIDGPDIGGKVRQPMELCWVQGLEKRH